MRHLLRAFLAAALVLLGVGAVAGCGSAESRCGGLDRATVERAAGARAQQELTWADADRSTSVHGYTLLDRPDRCIVKVDVIASGTDEGIETGIRVDVYVTAHTDQGRTVVDEASMIERREGVTDIPDLNRHRVITGAWLVLGVAALLTALDLARRRPPSADGVRPARARRRLLAGLGAVVSVIGLLLVPWSTWPAIEHPDPGPMTAAGAALWALGLAGLLLAALWRRPRR